MKKAVCNTMKFLLSALVPVLMIVMFYYVITWLNETGKWEFNITSVSYTHLDVYKRQL